MGAVQSVYVRRVPALSQPNWLRQRKPTDRDRAGSRSRNTVGRESTCRTALIEPHAGHLLRRSMATKAVRLEDRLNVPGEIDFTLAERTTNKRHPNESGQNMLPAHRMSAHYTPTVAVISFEGYPKKLVRPAYPRKHYSDRSRHSQLTTRNPGTRLNSASLFVTNCTPRLSACAAIRTSRDPII